MGGTNFLARFWHNLVQTIFIQCPFGKYYLFSKFLNSKGHMEIHNTGCPKKSIHCLMINRTKRFCQNFKISYILIRKHLTLNFETKIVEIRRKLSETYYYKAKNVKFFASQICKIIWDTFSPGLFRSYSLPSYDPLNFKVIKKINTFQNCIK